MWNKIKLLFQKEKEREQGWVSGFRFKDSIKALGMEVYKDITIVYLEKPRKECIHSESWVLDKEICNKCLEKLQPIYHFFYKKEFYHKEAETYEALLELAHKDIDNL